MQFIAQLDRVDPGVFRDWIIVFASLIGLAVGVFVLVEKIRAMRESAGVTVSPDPLRVAAVERWATRQEVEAMAQAIESDIEELRGAMAEERKVARFATGNLHKRIDEIVETMAETKGLLAGVKDNTDRLLARSMK